MRITLLAASAALATGVLACAADSTLPIDQLPTGTWGGQGATAGGGRLLTACGVRELITHPFSR